MFGCIRNKKNGKMLKLINEENVSSEKLDEYIDESDELLQSATGIVFDFEVHKQV